MFKNFIYHLLSEMVKILSLFITVPYIFRLFSPDTMGEIQYTLSLSGWFALFAGFGIYGYGLRELSRVRDDRQKCNQLFTSLFVISFLASLIAMVAYLFYIYYAVNKSEILRYLLLLNSIQLFAYFFNVEYILEAFEDYQFLSLKSILIKVLNITALVVFIRSTED